MFLGHFGCVQMVIILQYFWIFNFARSEPLLQDNLPLVIGWWWSKDFLETCLWMDTQRPPKYVCKTEGQCSIDLKICFSSDPPHGLGVKSGNRPNRMAVGCEGMSDHPLRWHLLDTFRSFSQGFSLNLRHICLGQIRDMWLSGPQLKVSSWLDAAHGTLWHWETRTSAWS